MLETQRYEKDFFKSTLEDSVVINVSFVAVNHECGQCLIYLAVVYFSENSYYKKEITFSFVF